VPTTQPGTSLPPVNQTEAQQVSAPAPARGTGPLPIILGALAVVALLGIGFVATRGGSTQTPKDPKTPTVEVTPFSGLDALYGSWKEPVPPASCRRVEDAPRLAAIATDVTALGVVDANPESSYLLARATFERDRSRSPALEKALACPNFAAASNLAGRLALAEKDVDQARKFFLAAIAASPSFLNARYNLALIYVQSKDFEAAKDKLDNLIAEAPDFGEAYLLRAVVVQVQGDAPATKKDICMAAKLGVEKAKAECAKLSGSP